MRTTKTDRDVADAQFIAKAWRFIAYKDSGPSLFFSRLQQVDKSRVTTFRTGDSCRRRPRTICWMGVAQMASSEVDAALTSGRSSR